MSDRTVRVCPAGQPRPASASAATRAGLNQLADLQLSDPVGPYMATRKNVLHAHREPSRATAHTIDRRRHHRDPRKKSSSATWTCSPDQALCEAYAPGS
jgi:hypothetical protein